MSKRKPHNGDCGYIAEKIFKPTGSHIVIYRAAEQGIDVGPDKYAIVCSLHATIVGTTNVPDARGFMKYPEFCEECMNVVSNEGSSVVEDKGDSANLSVSPMW